MTGQIRQQRTHRAILKCSRVIVCTTYGFEILSTLASSLVAFSSPLCREIRTTSCANSPFYPTAQLILRPLIHPPHLVTEGILPYKNFIVKKAVHSTVRGCQIWSAHTVFDILFFMSCVWKVLCVLLDISYAFMSCFFNKINVCNCSYIFKLIYSFSIFCSLIQLSAKGKVLLG